MKKFFLTISLCVFFLGYSQGENDNWYFGQYGALNFANPASPAVLSNSAMWIGFNSPSGSVSDSSGKLLFYSNGATIWNRDHDYMYGATLSNSNPFQFAIVKHPTNNNIYYIFNSGDVSSSYTFEASYTVIDMSLGPIGSDGLPLGEVVNYKVPLLNSSGNPFTYAKGVTIVPHANMDSFWVLISDNVQLHSYHLTSSGVNPVPVTSSVYFENQPPSPFQHYSYLKASPKLNSCNKFSHYLSLCTSDFTNSYNEGRVYSFNDNTGQITADYLLEVFSLNPVRAEFNKDSSILYLGSHLASSLLAVNLQASTTGSIVYNDISPASTPGDFVSVQRNKYGEIYVQYNYHNYISKIINPDSFGSSSLDLYYLNNSNPNGAGVGVFPQLVPTLSYSPAAGCVPDITLSSPETNAAFTYSASNTITAQSSYSVASAQNIVMKAGNNITLLPDTKVDFGADYLATIEDCDCEKITGRRQSSNERLFLDLRAKQKDKNKAVPQKIKVYPNPASDILNIKSGSKINTISVTDLTGKKINVRLEGDQVDVRNLPAGTYLINVETKDGLSTEKFIKK